MLLSLFNENPFNRNEILGLIEKVDCVTPDTERFSEIYVSFALDACTSVYSTLNYINDHELGHIIDVAICATDTVDMFIQERDDIGFSTIDIEDRISNDPLRIREKMRQKHIIERILDMQPNTISDHLIESLRDKTPLINIDIL